MKRYYTTYDVHNGEFYEENADLKMHESGTLPDVEPLFEMDCWVKVPANWTDDEISAFAEREGVHKDDLIVQRDGEHPGLPGTWIDIKAPIFDADVLWEWKEEVTKKHIWDHIS